MPNEDESTQKLLNIKMLKRSYCLKKEKKKKIMIKNRGETIARYNCHCSKLLT